MSAPHLIGPTSGHSGTSPLYQLQKLPVSLNHFISDREYFVRNRKTERVETTVGRVLLYEIVPAAVPFSEVNRTMKKKEL